MDDAGGLILLELVAFAAAWWLGLYLLARDFGDEQLRLAGLGLISYGLGLSGDLLARAAPEPTPALVLARWGWPFLFLPAFFWLGSLIYFLPEEAPWRRRLAALTRRWLAAFGLLFYLMAGGTELFARTTSEGLQPSALYPLLAGLLAIAWIAALALLVYSQRAFLPAPTWRLVVVATLFFGLGIGLLLFPVSGLPRRLLVLGVGADLILLGLAIAYFDAFAQGEALLPDFWRSAAYAAFAVLLFAGQVMLVMALGTGFTFTMLVLLWATAATSIAFQTLADPIQTLLDYLVFRRLPWIRQARAESRVVSGSLARSRELLDPNSMNEQQFGRLTRRALGQMGNLPKLAASPLTRLGLLEERLRQRGADDNTLERAAELKSLLAESIDRLKPRDGRDFGATDEWRHYNALYFPYVVGLKPYSRRVEHVDLDPTVDAALEWFRSQVPERTLYNWQTAAAALVAQDIREQAHRDN